LKLAVTGASGFVGREIVPLLQEAEIDLLLVGRDPEQLRKDFPGCQVAGYGSLATTAVGCDAIAHLAVLNNDQTGTLEDFRAANVELLSQVLSYARAARVPTFIYTTTLHSTNTKNTSHYATTKREAEHLLSQEGEIAVVRLRLPAIFGSTFKGKLTIVKKFPRALRPTVLFFLSFLRPTAHVSRVARAILEAAHTGQPGEKIVTGGEISVDKIADGN
jgi:nucleoside-diphosphate-sugar epimerase